MPKIRRVKYVYPDQRYGDDRVWCPLRRDSCNPQCICFTKDYLHSSWYRCSEFNQNCLCVEEELT